MLEDLWIMRFIIVAITNSHISQAAVEGLRTTEAPKPRLCVEIL